MSVCPRIDPLHFLSGCPRRRLNHCLVVALGFSVSVRYGMLFCGFWMHSLFNSILFGYQYQCN